MRGTNCADEQPCELSNCEHCDPFSDGEKVGPHKIGEPDPTVHIAAPMYSGLPPIDSVEGEVFYRDPLPVPASAIPSLSDCYTAMKGRYAEYEGKLGELALAENNVTLDRITLEEAKTAVLLRYTDPKELGSNEAQRATAIAQHAAAQTLKLQMSQRSVELLKCETEIARLRCRMADNTLRFCEALIVDKGHDEYAQA